MKILTLPILLLCIFILSSFMPGGDDKKISDNFIVSTKGDTTFMYGDVEDRNAYVYFNNKKGKKEEFSEYKIEYMFVDNQIFKRLPTFTPTRYMIQEIVAYNDKYVLTVLGGDIAYIWTDKFENVEKKLYIQMPATEQKKLIEKHIIPYFGSCKEMIAKMYATLEEGSKYHKFFYGISNYHCLDK